MPRIARLPLALLLVCCLIPICTSAQDDPAFTTAEQAFSSYHGGDVDHVDLFSGNLSIDIPLMSYPQNGGKLNLSFGLHYQSGPATDTYYCDDSGDCSDNWSATNHGWVVGPEGMPTGGGGFDQESPYCYMDDSYGSPEPVYCFAGGAVSALDQAVHQLLPTSAASFNYSLSGWRTADGSGYALTPNGLLDSAGTLYKGGGELELSNYLIQPWASYPGPSALPTQIIDTNGNQITGNQTTDQSGMTWLTSWTDSIAGRPSIPAPVLDSPVSSQCPTVSGQPAAKYSFLWNFPSPNGGTSPVRICLADAAANDPYYGHYPDMEIQSIVLSNGTAWTFDYDVSGPGYTGNLMQVNLPTGGSVSYQWTGGPRVCNFSACSGAIVASRTTNANDGSPAGTWQYSYSTVGSGNSAQYLTTVTDPAGNDAVHTFTNLDTNSDASYFETNATYFQGTGGSRTQLKTVYTSYQYATPFDAGCDISGKPYVTCESDLYGYAINVFPKEITTQLSDTGQTSSEAYSYDSAVTFYQPVYYMDANPPTYSGASSWTGSLGSRLVENDYDYGQGLDGYEPLLRTTTTALQYSQNSNYLAANLLRLPYSVSISGSGPGAYTYYGYDENTQCVCGNETSVHQWLNTNSTYLVTNSAYDPNGRITSTTDPKGNPPTSFGYGSCYAGSGPTSITNPLNQTTSYCYDLNTGLQTSVTDANNQTTSTAYDDMLRVTQVTDPLQTLADNAQLHGSTSYTYPSATEAQISELMDDQGHSKNSTLLVDGLGRTSHTQLNSDPEGVDYVDTTYDSMGRVASVTNPYRSTSDPTYGATSYAYDALGRVHQVTEQDGSIVSYSYSGNCTTVTDEAGKKRESCTDALGRLTSVVEDPGGLGYTTTYTYDALNNLTGVTQNGSHQRSFVYDSLSRLTSATNPESGTTNYTYDADSNVLTKTDARNITTNYSYDALNRLTQKSYSDGTPTAVYAYDNQAPWDVPQANLVGRLEEVWTDTGSTAAIFSYDSMGRVVMSDQYTTAMRNQTASATYDLLGDVTSSTYPDGRVVESYYSAAARPTQVTFDNFNGTYVGYSYLSAANYAPDGGPANTTLGNGVTEASTYNDRLQPCNQQIATGSSNWISRTYSFYLSGACTGSSGNNGNVMNIADNLQNGRTQAFAYDALNRLAVAHTWATSGPDCWGNSFGYDQWGNLTQQNVTQCSAPYMNLSINANNQITNSGFAYDASGNLTLNSPNTYQYDAENRLTNYNSGAGLYTYDAEGNRVQKQAGGVTTDYIYFGGQPIAEYNPATQDWSDYIYDGSRRLARADSYENGIMIQGTNDGSSNWPNTWFRLNDANYLSGTYTIQAGDYLYERQYQNNARGGMGLFFRDGTNNAWQSTDQNGNYMNDDPNQLVWDERSFNLTAFAGKVVDWVGIDTDAHTPPGTWAVVYGDIAIVSADGTVHPIYSASANFSVSLEWATGSTGVSVTNRHISNIASYPSTTTNYYHGDHLGSQRLMTGYNGYPTWSATFLPFGEEWNPQATVNHYKFTGKERDDESNLDNFGARYLTSTYGRFMSPDPENAGAAPSDPQSWNSYSYVENDPLDMIDPSGMDGINTNDGWTACNGTGAGFEACIGAYTNCVPAEACNPNDPSSWPPPSDEGLCSTNGMSIDCDFVWDELRNGSAAVVPEDGQKYRLTDQGLQRWVPGPPPLPNTPCPAGAICQDVYQQVSHWENVPVQYGVIFGPSGGLADLGGVLRAERIAQLTEEAEGAYPKLAAKAGTELHHIFPKYLGGAADGETVALRPAYHQLITNAFRALAPYGRSGVLTAEEITKIVEQVYLQYPLP